jgi:hypothetical protein
LFRLLLPLPLSRAVRSRRILPGATVKIGAAEVRGVENGAVKTARRA